MLVLVRVCMLEMVKTNILFLLDFGTFRAINRLDAWANFMTGQYVYTLPAIWALIWSEYKLSAQVTGSNTFYRYDVTEVWQI